YYNDAENLIDVTNDFRFTDYQNGVGINFGNIYGATYIIKVISKENEAVNKDLVQSVDMYSTSQNGIYNSVSFYNFIELTDNSAEGEGESQSISESISESISISDSESVSESESLSQSESLSESES
ncbi:hypothetical protein RPO40_12505, partial [Mammaliicoccus fleurettii]|nr:hypothetical protein [Mammaliicoccus fleurettii]